MFKKLSVIALAFATCAGLYLGLSGEKESRPTIGIVAPIEHQAMEDMTAGFREVVAQQYGDNVRIEFQNAQGDETLLRAIVSQYARGDYEMIVPIGTELTLMTLKISDGKPVVGLDVTDQVPQRVGVTGVRESRMEPSFSFMRALYPDMKKFTVVYSTSEKIYEQVQELEKAAEAEGISVQPLMIQTLADLYTLSKGVASDSEMVFIFKDHLVASGAPSLARVAETLQVPLMTSDEGTVIAGAAFAVGNRETDIGRQGATLAVQILSGVDAQDLPMEPVPSQTLFINKAAAHKQGAVFKDLCEAAKKEGLPVVIVDQNEAGVL